MFVLRIIASIQKEFILLSRDRVGLLVLFVMPLALVSIMALIQDAPFKDYQAIKISVLFVNMDGEKSGDQIRNGLEASGMFDITSSPFSYDEAREEVDAGHYQIAVLIPDSTTERLRMGVAGYVSQTLAVMGAPSVEGSKEFQQAAPVVVYVNPRTKHAFVNAINGYMKQAIAQIESSELFLAFKLQMGLKSDEDGLEKNVGSIIPVQVVNTPFSTGKSSQMNSVQHNVPAWTMFGMFFIVISLAGSMVTERELGSYSRIKTMPGSYVEIILSKLMAYMVVCLIQCMMMLLTGLFLLPELGLEKLEIGSAYSSLIIVTISSALAATGYGIFVGTIFNTHQQASNFGSVSVVILAALGGIWVPVSVMPGLLKTIADYSPLNWGLNAYQNVFLGDGSLSSVSEHVCLLLLFFAATVGFAMFFEKMANNWQGN